MAVQNLIEPKLLRRLELLRIQSHRPLSSTDTGDRKSRRHGLSIEFSDYREYRPGDDLRYVDWKAYGRLGKLFLKLYQDEEDVRLHLLIDCSKSMGFGEPVSKWRYAQRAAAAIGFVALHENNRVDVSAFNSSIAGRIPALRGDVGIPIFFSALSALPPPIGETKFSETVRQFAAAAPAAGLVIVFSDFFDASVEAGLQSLAGRRHEAILVQVLDREEASPQFGGDFSLIDSETGETHEVIVTDEELSQYQDRLHKQTASLKAIANRYGMSYLSVVTDQPLEELVLGSLRVIGAVG